MDYRWVAVVVVTLLVWGVWGVLTRVASASLGWRDTTAIAALGHMLFAISYIFLSRAQVAQLTTTWSVAFMAGGLGFLGALTFYVALNLNPSPVVIVATSLYPVVTLVLSYLFLGDSLSLRQIIGVGFALIALILISE